MEGFEGLLEGFEGLLEGSEVKRMDGRNFSPFYRTLSPVGAAAQKVYYCGQAVGNGIRRDLRKFNQ